MIRRRVRDRLPALRACYEKRLLQDPDLAGTVTADFAINERGLVVIATIAGFGDAELDRCVWSALIRIRFPSQKNGGYTRVTYPFTFRRRD